MSEETADLIAAALDHGLKVLRARLKTHKYFKLIVCEDCFHSHITDYVVLGCIRDGVCDLCDSAFHLGFELLFAEVDKIKGAGH